MLEYALGQGTAQGHIEHRPQDGHQSIAANSHSDELQHRQKDNNTSIEHNSKGMFHLIIY